MRQNSLTYRVLQLGVVFAIVTILLGISPTGTALAVSCDPNASYETNNSEGEACTVGPAANLNLSSSVTFSVTQVQTDNCGDFDYNCTLWRTPSCTAGSTEEDWFSFNVQQGFTFGFTLARTGGSYPGSSSSSVNNSLGAQFKAVAGTVVYDQSANSTSYNYSYPVTSNGTVKVRQYLSTSAAEAHCETGQQTFSCSRPTWFDDFTCTSNSDTRNVTGTSATYSWNYNLTTTYTPPPNPVLEEDSYEQNDYSTVPSSVGNPFNETDPNDPLTIFPAGDDDWYRFYGFQGPFTITAGSGYAVDLVVQLYSPSNVVTPLYSAQGTNPILNGTLAQEGFYLVRVDSVDGTKQTPYTLTIANTGPQVSADSFEQNDVLATAGDLGTLTDSTFDNNALTMFPSCDDDYYRFFVSEGTVDVALYSFNTAVTYDLQMLDTGGSALGATATGTNPALSRDVTTTGNYYVRVDAGCTGSTPIGGYRLVITHNSPTAGPITGDSYEENDTTNTSSVIAGLPFADASLTMFPAGDDDYFRFFASPGTVTAQIFTSNPAIPFTIRLLSPGGTQLATNSGANPQLTSIAITDTGYYTVHVDSSSVTEVGFYQLNISYLPPAVGPISADQYEENDSQVTATNGGTGGVFNATMYPGGDDDWYRFLVNTPGIFKANVFSTIGGLNYEMTIYDPDGVVLGTGPITGPNPAFSLKITKAGYYLIKIDELTNTEVAYQLVVSNTQPTATPVPPTPMPTGTPGPTSTPSPTPTATVTPDMGGEPDIAEENNSFAMAFRISPGNTISLNFAPKTYGVDDIDYFAMNVKTDVTYTCETSRLGLGTDTVMNIYGPAADSSNLIASHDDIDSQTGDVASLITWKSAYTGQAFIVVDQVGTLTYPGAATYDLDCYTGTARPRAAGGGAFGGGSGGGGGMAGLSGSAGSAVRVQIVGAPKRIEPPAPNPVGTLIVNILIAYDENANDLIDLSEGVLGMSVRAIDVMTNKQLAHGFTDSHGSLQLIITAPQGNQVLIVVPYLSVGKTFTVNENSNQNWPVLLESSLLPGLIP